MIKNFRLFSSANFRAALLFTAFLALSAFVAPQAMAHKAAAEAEIENMTAKEICDEDNENSWQWALNDAAVAYQAAAEAAGRRIYNKMNVTNLTDCIKSIKVHFDTIQKLLLSTVSAIAAIILTVLNEILSAVCSYIIDSIQNVLNMACIQAPNLGFSFSLPSLTQNSCDGVSLADFISINGYGGSFPSGMPTLSIQGMSLGDSLYWANDGQAILNQMLGK